MSRMHPSTRLALAAGFLAAAAPLPAAAAFNTWDLISRTIPASACTPRDAATAPRVEMVAGAWRFVGAQVGRVTLSCPLPVSYFPADKAQYGAPPTELFEYRVWYRDGDGAAAQAAVRVTPYRRDWLGNWTNIGLAGGGGGIVPAGVCEFNSNAFPDVLFAVHVKDCHHVVEINALYTFEVVMSRELGTQAVEFHGIDFWSYGGPAG